MGKTCNFLLEFLVSVLYETSGLADWKGSIIERFDRRWILNILRTGNESGNPNDTCIAATYHNLCAAATKVD